MAFLAKQFMSLLLLLIISRLILSTHAGRHFSQVARNTDTTTTTTTSLTNQNPDNYGKFSQPETQTQTQPTFFTDKYNPHGLGNTPPPFRPLNYDTKMYTTSRETQKNMYNQENKNQMTVAEKFGAYRYQPNDMEEIPTTSSEKQTKVDHQSYHKDNTNNQHNNAFYQQYAEENGVHYSTRYDNKANSVSKPFYFKDNSHDPAREESKQTRYTNANDEVEDVEGDTPFFVEGKGTTTYSNSKYEEQNQQQYPWSSYNDKTNGEQQQYNDWAYKKQNSFNTAKQVKDTTHVTETDEDLDKLLEEEDELPNAYNKHTSRFDKYYGKSTPAKPVSYRNYKKDNNKYFANTDEELNAILDAEEEEDEKESKPDGLSDTRLWSNKRYQRPDFWNNVNVDQFANAFSGNALAQAAQNNNP